MIVADICWLSLLVKVALPLLPPLVDIVLQLLVELVLLDSLLPLCEGLVALGGGVGHGVEHGGGGGNTVLGEIRHSGLPSSIQNLQDGKVQNKSCQKASPQIDQLDCRCQQEFPAKPATTRSRPRDCGRAQSCLLVHDKWWHFKECRQQQTVQARRARSCFAQLYLVFFVPVLPLNAYHSVPVVPNNLGTPSYLFRSVRHPEVLYR